MKLSREEISHNISMGMAGCHQPVPPLLIKQSPAIRQRVEQTAKAWREKEARKQGLKAQLSQERRKAKCSTDTARALARPDVVTPSMAAVLQVVTDLASRGAVMPNNPDLGELAGGYNRSAAFRALERLEAVGRIRVDYRGARRRVMVVATGKKTAWGKARPGHSPFVNSDVSLPASAAM